MTLRLHHALLATTALLTPLTFSGQATAALTVVSSGALIDLKGATVGQVRVERQGGRTYLHVIRAGRAAGTSLELLVSTTAHPLVAGDHGGPGLAAVRAGLLEQAEVRTILPLSVRSSQLRSVWVWCRSVRLPSARASLRLSSS